MDNLTEIKPDRSFGRLMGKQSIGLFEEGRAGRNNPSAPCPSFAFWHEAGTLEQGSRVAFGADPDIGARSAWGRCRRKSPQLWIIYLVSASELDRLGVLMGFGRCS
jgi:hypothetical protein